MFTKKSLRITLAFVLLIGLASLGIAYGAWSDTLVINGTVKTGALDVNFYPGDPTVEVDPLNIGTCNVLYGDDVVTINVEKAYPGYQCGPRIVIKNDGDVPIDASIVFGGEIGPGVYVDGYGMPVPVLVHLVPNGEHQFTFNIDVFNPANGNGTYTFSYSIVANQATLP